MARARNIKPKFFQNDELGELSPLARLLFIGMWTIADYRGCLEYRPKRIKTQLLPYDECDIESLSISLDKSGFISMYSVQGQRYVKILKFEKHQTPHKNERESGSEIPDIDQKDNEISELTQDGNTPDKNGTDPASNCFLNPSNCSLNPEPIAANPGKTNVELKPDAAGENKERRKVTDKRSDAGEAVRRVFVYWQQARGHERAHLDAKREKAIKARLTDGYSAEDLCRAVDGIAKSAHHMGQNDARTVYDDIELICRNAANVDKFAKLAGPSSTIDPGLQRQVDILKDWMAQE